MRSLALRLGMLVVVDGLGVTIGGPHVKATLQTRIRSRGAAVVGIACFSDGSPGVREWLRSVCRSSSLLHRAGSRL
jgi:hypothetical protein